MSRQVLLGVDGNVSQTTLESVGGRNIVGVEAVRNRNSAEVHGSGLDLWFLFQGHLANVGRKIISRCNGKSLIWGVKNGT